MSGESLDAMGWVTMHSSGAAVIARHDSLTREWVHFAKRCTGGVVHTELLGVFGDGSGSKRGDCCIEDMGRSGFGGQTVAGVRQGLGQVREGWRCVTWLCPTHMPCHMSMLLRGHWGVPLRGRGVRSQSMGGM